ncbi:MAG: hypothetical protein IJ622_12350, partial [Bacteroidales bacterium]|nr:hypothetical protein [Bacteroidales bacterium]
ADFFQYIENQLSKLHFAKFQTKVVMEPRCRRANKANSSQHPMRQRRFVPAKINKKTPPQ